MLGRRVGDRVGDQVDKTNPGGYIDGGILQTQGTIGGIVNEHRVRVELRDTAYDLTGNADDNGSLATAAGHITDRDEDASVGEVDGVVPIASDLCVAEPRFVNGVERATGDVGKCERKNGALKHC